MGRRLSVAGACRGSACGIGDAHETGPRWVLRRDGARMNIHEYQAKSLLKRYGVSVPRGGVAYTPEEADSVVRHLGGSLWVVRPQIHAGGRGAQRFRDDQGGGGGVRVVTPLAALRYAPDVIVGGVLGTKQTGPDSHAET